MKLHDRAWEGFHFVVLSSDPLSAMEIEQSISQALPQVEVSVDSFERYDDAYQHCKIEKNVNGFFISDSGWNADPTSIMRELSALCAPEAPPPFTVFLYSHSPNATLTKAFLGKPLVLDYLALSDMRKVDFIAVTFGELWNRYIERFSAHFVSQPLLNALEAVALRTTTTEHLTTEIRLLTSLESSLNTSWFEHVAIKFYPLISRARAIAPEMIESNSVLRALWAQYPPEQKLSSNELKTLIQSNSSLVKKVLFTAQCLIEANGANQLGKTISDLTTDASLRSPKMIRNLKANAEAIKSILGNERGYLKVA